MNSELIQQISTFIKDWIPKEASYAIVLDRQYVYYNAGMYDIHLKVGQYIESGGIAEKTLTNNHKTEALVEQSSSGNSFYGIGYPVQIKEGPAAVIVILPPTYFYQQKEPLCFLTGKSDELWFPIPLEQVAYIESHLKKTWFYSNGVCYSSIHTLKALEKQLPHSFLRMHRSYIVNIQYIQQISRDHSSNFQLTLKDETVLPVSTTYTNDFRTKLGF